MKFAARVPRRVSSWRRADLFSSTDTSFKAAPKLISGNYNMEQTLKKVRFKNRLDHLFKTKQKKSGAYECRVPDSVRVKNQQRDLRRRKKLSDERKKKNQLVLKLNLSLRGFDQRNKPTRDMRNSRQGAILLLLRLFLRFFRSFPTSEGRDLCAGELDAAGLTD